VFLTATWGFGSKDGHFIFGQQPAINLAWQFRQIQQPARLTPQPMQAKTPIVKASAGPISRATAIAPELVSSGLSPAGMDKMKQVKMPNLDISEAALPGVWKAGPANVYSGQARMASELLKEDPGLFDASIDNLLENMSERREKGDVQQKGSARVVTELLYLKVSSMFKKLQIPLIPTLQGVGEVNFNPVDFKSLTKNVYSGDAMELVREHLSRIIEQSSGQNAASDLFMDGKAILSMPLFEASQVYVISCLFGYSLRNADQRFQLEKLAGSMGAGHGANTLEEDKNSAQSLMKYISLFGPEDMQRILSISSVQARSVMELQVGALFGNLSVLKAKFAKALEEIFSSEQSHKSLMQAFKDNEVESISMTHDDLTRLVLEAVAFGSLLNDAEKQIHNVYELTPQRSPQEQRIFAER
jgi:hypothetical protein